MKLAAQRLWRLGLWRLALVLGALGSPAATAQAQTTLPSSPGLVPAALQSMQASPFAPASAPESIATPAPAGGWEPSFLRSMPRPPDQPGSLLQGGPYRTAVPDAEGPFMEADPQLEPPTSPPPGWYWDVQIAAVKPHVHNDMNDFVTTGGGAIVAVGANQGPIPMNDSPVSWTGVLRFELGYRLLSGLGEITLSDTFLVTQGSQTVARPDGPGTYAAKLFLNYSDLDYVSREFTPFANWDMKWRFGTRFVEGTFKDQFSQPMAQAAAGTGIYSLQETNRLYGPGFHCAVELERRFQRPGFSFISKVDVGDAFARIHQTFAASTTGAGSGSLTESVLQQLPMLTVQAGFGWQPPRRPYSRLFMGYLDETWWNFMTNRTSGTSFGNVDYQGMVVRWQVNY